MGSIGAGSVNLEKQAARGMWPMHDEMSLADLVVFFGHLADLGYAIYRWARWCGARAVCTAGRGVCRLLERQPSCPSLLLKAASCPLPLPLAHPAAARRTTPTPRAAAASSSP